MKDRDEREAAPAGTGDGLDSKTRHGQRINGREAKQAILGLFETNRAECLREARRVFLDALREQGRATINSVRQRMAIPEVLDPRWLGAVPKPFAARGIIRRAGFVESERAHGRMIALWQLEREPTAEELAAIFNGQPKGKRRPDRPDADGQAPVPAVRTPEQTPGTGGAAAAAPLFADLRPDWRDPHRGAPRKAWRR